MASSSTLSNNGNPSAESSIQDISSTSSEEVVSSSQGESSNSSTVQPPEIKQDIIAVTYPDRVQTVEELGLSLIHILDKLTYAGNLSTLTRVMTNPCFRFVQEDICNREAVDGLFQEERPNVVVNFAAESDVDRSIENPELFLQTNVTGTAVLMDACRKYGISRFHQISTDERCV